MKNELHIFRVGTNSHLKSVDRSMRRIASFPVSRRSRNANRNANSADNVDTNDSASESNDGRNVIIVNANLTKQPKTLYKLWDEWEFGIGGNKPAKLFSPIERGRVKFQYSLRKCFWNLCSEMIRRGYTSGTAIDKIYSVYVGMSLTQILRSIRNENRTGGNPELQGSPATSF